MTTLGHGCLSSSRMSAHYGAHGRLPHGAFTFALLEGLSGKADRNGNGTVEVRELADYVEERLPEISRKWGYEQFPFSATEGSSFTLVPKKP